MRSGHSMQPSNVGGYRSFEWKSSFCFSDCCKVSLNPSPSLRATLMPPSTFGAFPSRGTSSWLAVLVNFASLGRAVDLPAGFALLATRTSATSRSGTPAMKGGPVCPVHRGGYDSRGGARPSVQRSDRILADRCDRRRDHPIITGCALRVIRNLKGKKMDGDLRLRTPDRRFAQALALIPELFRATIGRHAAGMNQETASATSFMLTSPSVWEVSC